MTSQDVAEIVRAQIGGDWKKSNAHGVDLARCLVPPVEISMIAPTFCNGRVGDEMLRAWLVLEERPFKGDGYKIVFGEALGSFGLVCGGFPADPHPVL